MKTLLSVGIFVLFIHSTTAQTITTIAGTTSGFSGDGGPALQAQLTYPTALALDKDQNLYVADAGNGRVRKILRNGIITTFAGGAWYNAADPTFGDGKPAAEAVLGSPQYLAFDRQGNLFIGDSINPPRKVNTEGIVSSLPSPNSSFNYNLFGIAINPEGKLFGVAYPERVVRLDGSGYTDITGPWRQGSDGDGGPAINGFIHDYLSSLAFDSLGNLYVTDRQNNRIRRIDKNGIITTIAGNGQAGSTGDGGPANLARIDHPSGIAIDKYSNIYFSQSNTSTVRKIDTNGIISTIAGNGLHASTGDGGPALQASLYYPHGIAVDKDNNIYISEYIGHRIRKITFNEAILPITLQYFKAEKSGDDVVLNWQVSSDNDPGSVEIQGSDDGRNFSPIAAMSLTRDKKKYEFRQKAKAGADVMYYRLKISESSGATKYSDVAAVHLDSQKRVVVNPNPIQNKTFSLLLQSLPKGDYSIKVLNTAGRSELIKSVTHTGGNSTHQIRLDAGLAAGTYIITVSSGRKKYTAQVIVL